MRQIDVAEAVGSDDAGTWEIRDGMRARDAELEPPRGVLRREAGVASPRAGLGASSPRPDLRAVPARASAPVSATRPVPPRRPGAYRGLPAPLAIAGWGVFAIAIGAAIGLTVPAALRGIGATIALQPSILPWYGVRAFGFLAYLALAGSVVYGLLLSTKLLDAIAHRPVSFALHKDLALVGLLVTAVHGGLLLADHTFAFTARALLVPFASPYAPLWVGAGQLSFYAFAIVAGSFYVRRQIGQRAWRAIHYLTFAAFIAAAAHGIASGSDSGERWAFWLYLVPIAAAVFLTVYRIVVASSGGLRRHYAPAPAARAAPASAPATAPAPGGPSQRPAPRALPARSPFD